MLLGIEYEWSHLKEEHVIQFSSISAYLRERKASALAPPFQAQVRLPLAVNRNPIGLSVRREEY